MRYDDNTYRKRCELLHNGVLKNVSLEILLHYLKPDERRALSYMLSEGMGANAFNQYQSIEDILSKYTTSYTEDGSVFDITYYVNSYSKCKIMNHDFMKSFPTNTNLNLNDKFQNCLFTFSKIIYRDCYQCINKIDFTDIKENYYSYEKVVKENISSRLDQKNLFFNLIFIQGLMAEIKQDIVVLKAANISIVNLILLTYMYDLITAINCEKEKYLQDQLINRYSEYILNTVSEVDDRKSKIIEKMKDEAFKQREKLNLYEDKIKFLQKNNSDSLISNLYEDTRKKDAEIARLKNQLSSKDASITDRIEELNSKIENMHSENEKLLLKINELELKNVKLHAKLSLVERDYLLSDVKTYIDKNGKSEILRLLYGTKQDDASKATINSNVNYRIGNIKLTNNGIEVVTNLGNYPVHNIPEKTLVGEGQFVRIDSSNNFVYGYKYYANHRIIPYSDRKLGEIKYISGKPYIDFYSNMIPAVGINDEIQEGQIVLADTGGNIKIFFKKMHFVLDFFFEINKYRGLEAWRVVNILNDICIFENIETKRQKVYKPEENQRINLNDIILTKKDGIVNIFDFKFYSHSSYYQDSIQGIAEVKDDIIMLLKSNGEKCIVKNPNNIQNIETGDTLILDEYNNLIRYEKCSPREESHIVKKRNLIRINDKFKIKSLNIEKKILIIGNPTYQQSYMLNFLKKGYQPIIIDGYSSWSKVQKSMKDIDIIIVIVNYVSHDNMWAIKENVKDIPVLYPDSDGANRIIDMIDNYMNDEAI